MKYINIQHASNEMQQNQHFKMNSSFKNQSYKNQSYKKNQQKSDNQEKAKYSDD